MLGKLVHPWVKVSSVCTGHEGIYRVARCILIDDRNISFDASLVLLYIYIYIDIYIYIERERERESTNIPPIMIINKIYEHQNRLSL